MTYLGVGCAPGAAGELVQGQFASGQHFLISLPVNIWSQVEIRLDENTEELLINQPGKSKTYRAARLMLAKLGAHHFGGQIHLNSKIPIGKGMASSTADIIAVCRAIGSAFNMTITPQMISEIVRQIEPSDGTMYPNLVCYDHVKCERIESLGHLPPLNMLIIDPGGTVDTLTFNKQQKNYTAREIHRLAQAYHLAKHGIQEQDFDKIGQAGMLSANINQRLLYKPNLKAIFETIRDTGGLGICIGHSGTIISGLFPPGIQLLDSAKQKLREILPPTTEFIETQLLADQAR